MKYQYARYNNSVVRPVIPIKLKSGGNEVSYEVLVDSGADLCIFDEEIGEALGIDVRKGKQQEVFGVGGKASFYYLHKIKIDVGGWEYDIEAGFMPNVSGRQVSHGIVGQRGFFENFTVKFNKRKEEIELNRYL